MIVPTTYCATATRTFSEQAGFSLVIWANQLLRASIRAMRDTAHRLHADRSLIAVEDSIVSLGEVFRLQGEDALAAEEGHYLPRTDTTQAIILAASRGGELGELTAERPRRRWYLSVGCLFCSAS